mgnify:CR=1 FL=1
MNFREFLAEIRNLLYSLFLHQKTGNMIILHFRDDDILEFQKFYAPAFYNAGTATAIVEGISIAPGATMEFRNIPFAIDESVVSIRFNTSTGSEKDLVVSYGVLHHNRP